MKLLSPVQYQYLVAIEQKDYITLIRCGEILGSTKEMYNRGLYAGEILSTVPETMSADTAHLTSAGRTALMCYKVINTIYYLGLFLYYIVLCAIGLSVVGLVLYACFRFVMVVLDF